MPIAISLADILLLFSAAFNVLAYLAVRNARIRTERVLERLRALQKRRSMVRHGHLEDAEPIEI